jgi:hypothetical protein
MFVDVIIIAAVCGVFALFHALVRRWDWLKEAS